MKVLVTGANGFVGRALCPALVANGDEVVAAVREDGVRYALPGAARIAAVGEIGPGTDWSHAVQGRAAVVHLAARAHVMRDAAADPLALYRAINTEGTLNLARQAAAAGVRRFVFVSSVKVLGEERDAPYTEADAPAPRDAYARSKFEAEQGLWRIAQETGLEVVVLRPPLIYGPGVKANFSRLMHWVARGLPLPFGLADNRRSLLYVGNLADAIGHCLRQPQAAGQTFLVCDGEAVSTKGLVEAIARAMGRPACLPPVPTSLLRLLARGLGKQAEAGRLLGSLALDCAKLRQELAWRPPFTFEQGIRETVAAFANEGRPS